MKNIKNFFGMSFWQSLLASLCATYLSINLILFTFNKAISSVVKLGKAISEAQIYTTKNGSKIYEFNNNVIIERPDGTADIFPKMLHGIKESPGNP